jgi:hypothetical protein
MLRSQEAVMRTVALMLVGMIAVVAWLSVGVAAQTLADFDACNVQAQARAFTPSASPGVSSEGGRQPNASGRIAGSGGSPGTAAGTTSGALSPSAPAPTDPQSLGMAAAGRDDAVYAQAYRDCMRARGF